MGIVMVPRLKVVPLGHYCLATGLISLFIVQLRCHFCSLESQNVFRRSSTFITTITRFSNLNSC
jgi:hypothetical protein